MKIKRGEKIRLRGGQVVPVLGVQRAFGHVTVRDMNARVLHIPISSIRRNGRGLREIGSW